MNTTTKEPDGSLERPTGKLTITEYCKWEQVMRTPVCQSGKIMPFLTMVGLFYEQ
ncbi:MAG: hypothetical protein RBT80_17155 [Candidatus Vecturithrix sp.]|nr:hypothetical protein [Candidatus Vecturithrix sp.]